MKLLVWVSSLDLRHPFSSTPAWWQLLKALSEIGVEVLVAPYHGNPIESLWWQVYDNPCRTEGDIFEQGRKLMRRLVHSNGRADLKPKNEQLSDIAVRKLAQAYIRPRWQRHFSRILTHQKDVDALLILTVPPNHIVGLPTWIRERFDIPVVYYDGDVPASLPQSQGFASGFRIYQEADLSEFDLVLSNSKGGMSDLLQLGARRVDVLYYGVDPDVFRQMDLEKDIDVFFYGHGQEYREEWIESMIAQPSRAMQAARFGVRGTRLELRDADVQLFPYASLSKLREYCCRSKINLVITRKTHASVYASSTSRPFELAAMGCCMVSSPYSGIEEWFVPDEEVVLVDEHTDVCSVYTSLLANPRLGQEIGRRARTRVLAEHTFQQRARQLQTLIGSIH